MDLNGQFQSFPGHGSPFAWKPQGGPVSHDPNFFCARTIRSPASTGISHSHAIHSNLPAITRQSRNEFGERDPPADVPLDAFDKELLAEEPEEDRSDQASQGLARLSLPPQPIFKPTDCSTMRNAIRELHATPRARNGPNTYSSPPHGNTSSPTVMALSQRQERGRALASNRSLGQTQCSPSPNYHGTASSVPIQAGSQASIPSSRIQLSHAPPVVQGIPLVSVNDLPDRFRSLFPFQLFNAVQSKCFATAFKTDQNLVLSAPTGSGKTVVMELAICRLMQYVRGGEFKIVYQAPTKALCSERCTDWQAKFGSLDLQCAELTGDTDANQIRHVQAASIIITTPEKWDSTTRRWKDHAKLMNMVKLFLIDEVHILKESRGATLEAVVSRMKSTGSSVRFIALSATVPNSEDVAMWLGRDAPRVNLAAHREVFGEEFRPVRLQKVVYGYPVRSNDFIFDSILESKLPEIIAKHSQAKPIIIFCPFRKSCVKTAKSLAQLWTSTMPSHRLWSGPSRIPGILENDLREFIAAGVGFHHAGLDVSDRRAVEQAFLSRNLSIICCTSTLAVGVNLPCYLVIVKGTVAWTDKGLQEYADLEMMQMLGRAGRPQFDQFACAVILTRNERVDYYNRLVSGQEPLESCLHLNLIEHLNAEIGLGTIFDLLSAKRWLASTFLFVRLSRNSSHYRLKDDMTSKSDDELLEQICSKDVALLRGADLVTKAATMSCTELGDAMSRYYVKFDTMKTFLAMAPKAKTSEIMSAIAQAAEFRDIRLKSGEKALYKHINKDVCIKFPIKVDIALSAHKVSLLLQAELGGLDFPIGEQFAKHRNPFQQDRTTVFQYVNRLVRCVIDCQLTRNDSVSSRNALELARSFAARVWDNSPLQLKQLDQVGSVAVRKLANAGISSIESLENTEAHRIETVVGRGPPFGMKLLSKVAQFPKLRVLVKMVGKDIKRQKPPKIKLKAEVGFLNHNVPIFFHKKPVHVCFLAETSDGQMLDFRRIAASKLQSGHEVLLTIELTKPSQFVSCHVMCDEVAGTCRSVELRPNLPASLFTTLTELTRVEDKKSSVSTVLSRGQSQDSNGKRKQSEDFDNCGLDDRDLLAAESAEIVDIDAFDDELAALPSKKHQSGSQRTGMTKKQCIEDNREAPTQLKSGKWPCNHKCRDKTRCKHLCCKEGLDKPPKPSAKPSSRAAEENICVASMLDVINNQSSMQQLSALTNGGIRSEKFPLNNGAPSEQCSLPDTEKAARPDSLHEVTTPVEAGRSVEPAKSTMESGCVRAPRPSVAAAESSTENVHESSLTNGPLDLDWNNIDSDELESLGRPENSADQEATVGGLRPCPDDDSAFAENDEMMLEASLVGLEDSMRLGKAAPSGHISKDFSDSNASCSSGTIQESNFSRPERLPIQDVSNYDDGINDLADEDLEVVDPMPEILSKTGAGKPISSPSRDDELNTSPSKKLFFTSPERVRAASTDNPAEGTASQQGTNATISTPTANVGALVGKMSSPFSTDRLSHRCNRLACPGPVDIANKVIKGSESEQEQKLLMDGIDPSFYAEFKDFVDFI